MKIIKKKLTDMSKDFIVGDYKEKTLKHYNGVVRQVYHTDLEFFFPKGKLIVSVTNIEGYIIHANRAFIEMSGYSREELIGSPHAILRHPEMPAAAFADLWSSVQEHGEWSGYVKNLRKDGAFYWVYATIVAHKRNGKTVGYTSVRREASRKHILESIEQYKNI